MALARRSIMRMFGAAPLAAKAIADEQIAKLTGVNIGIPVSGGVCIGGPSQSPEVMAKVSTYIDAFGVPDFAQRQAWEQAQYVHALDHDIAVKRSWSMAVKIATQRQRNHERIMNGYRRSVVEPIGRAAFRSFAGVEWPW